MTSRNLQAQRIKEYRKRERLSQVDLEIKTDLASGSISRIEQKKTNPTKETLLKIAQALGLDRNEVIELFCLDQYLVTTDY